MNESSRRTLYWTPRILGLLFAGFLSLFALDAFDESGGLWRKVLAFAMHLVPTFLVLLFVGLAWRREWIGGIAFSALAIVYVASTWGRFPLTVYVAIAGPLILIGALFFLNWSRRADLRRA
ncbi:MAG TPA: hypothetical protein VLV48_07505 [Thermoanaerobaculia bacterium]|nr:hypothetical protein [Thermoanaerobaculia bacterium]